MRTASAVLWATLIAITAVPAAAPDDAKAATPRCAGLVATHVGTGGDDVMIGTEGDDVIVSRRGDDLIRGRGGNDTICSGPGDDVVSGGGGDDDIRGGSGADILRGNGGDDLIKGGPGDDLLHGGGRFDRLRGQGDRDRCRAGERLTSCLLGLRLKQVAQLDGAAGMVAAPDGDDRIFVLSQHGTIRVIGDDGLEAEPFLDLRGVVSSGGETGLLGLAFHPAFSDNGRLFVNYTADGGSLRTVIAEVTSDGESADPSTLRVILEVPQPFANHNGGMIGFGPDGHLYVALGDGGGGGDPLENGQNTATLLGSILRLDVDGSEPYEVPEDNPFVDTPGADEIWAFGLRNPWRFWFDDGLIYIADVGQSSREEISVSSSSEGALDYGWNTLEGSTCFDPPSGCSSAGTELPLVQVAHGSGSCSVIGGPVYRGRRLGELDGHYFYSDFCGRYLRSFLHDDGAALEKSQWLLAPANVTSLGSDSRGDLYVATIDGRVFRVLPVR